MPFTGGNIEVEVTGTYFIRPSPTHGPDVELKVTGTSLDVYVYQDDTYTNYLHVYNNEPRVSPVNCAEDDCCKYKVV